MNLILDDHPVVAQGLVTILKSCRPEMDILVTSSVAQALEMTKKNDIEMAFLDLYLNNESGFDFLEKIKKAQHKMKIFMITSSSKKSDFLRARELGVDAYVLKDAFIEELVYGLNVVDKGGKFYSQSLLESVNSMSEEEKLIKSLTEREIEVLALLREGYTNAMIAENLMISEGTVKKHISNILGKLSLNSRVNAVIFADKYNITR